MKRILGTLSAVLGSVAFGQPATGPTQFFTLTDVGSLAAMTLTAIGCAMAQGRALSKAVEGIARQPEAAGRIQGVLLLGLGFIESLAIYVLVICLIIIFANPAASVIAH